MKRDSLEDIRIELASQFGHMPSREEVISFLAKVWRAKPKKIAIPADAGMFQPPAVRRPLEWPTLKWE